MSKKKYKQKTGKIRKCDIESFIRESILSKACEDVIFSKRFHVKRKINHQITVEPNMELVFVINNATVEIGNKSVVHNLYKESNSCTAVTLRERLDVIILSERMYRKRSKTIDKNIDCLTITTVDGICSNIFEICENIYIVHTDDDKKKVTSYQLI